MTAELSKKAQEKVREIAQAIVEKREYMRGEQIHLSIGEFEALYRAVVALLANRNPEVSLLFLPDRVIALFPELSPQWLVVRSQNMKFLSPDLFSFVHRARRHGLRKAPTSFGRFLMVELGLHRYWLFLVFIVSFFGLHITGNMALYEMLSGLLIQSGTLFVSVFLIFSVTQSSLIQKDVSLFKQGILHQYRRDDRNIAILGIAVVIGVLFNTIFLGLPQEIASRFNFAVLGYNLTLMNFWGALTTSILIMVLFDAFLSIITYYLERSQDLVDRDLAHDVFQGEQARVRISQTVAARARTRDSN